MSIPLEELEEKDFRKLSILHTLALSSFKAAMTQLYPSDACRDMGRKYLQINFNQFKNDYLREVVKDKPNLVSYLRVYTGEYEIRAEKIDINITKLRNADDYNLNKIFDKTLHHKKFYDQLKRQNISPRE